MWQGWDAYRAEKSPMSTRGGHNGGIIIRLDQRIPVRQAVPNGATMNRRYIGKGVIKNADIQQ